LFCCWRRKRSNEKFAFLQARIWVWRPSFLMAPPPPLCSLTQVALMEGEQTRPRYAKSLCPLNSALAPKPCRSSPEIGSRKEVKNERPSKHARNQRSGNKCLSDCEVSRTSTRIKREFELHSSTRREQRGSLSRGAGRSITCSGFALLLQRKKCYCV
jgi:hypothetical protein